MIIEAWEEGDDYDNVSVVVSRIACRVAELGGTFKAELIRLKIILPHKGKDGSHRGGWVARYDDETIVGTIA